MVRLIRIKKLIQMGTSLGVVIDKPDIEKLKLKKGDYLRIKFGKYTGE